MTIALIENRSLNRECLAKALRHMADDVRVLAFADYSQWRRAFDGGQKASVVLYSCHGRLLSAGALDRTLLAIKDTFCDVPVLLLSDIEEPDTIIAVVDSGIRGYIPTSASLDVALEAMRLVRVGGTYLPASVILGRHRQAAVPHSSHETAGCVPSQSKFTVRQHAVLNALRQGKANKLIAYDLDLKESTVKVHMRNIMKKLRATNRTEVVCMLNDETSPAL